MFRRLRWRIASGLVGKRDWQSWYRKLMEEAWSLSRRGQKLPWHDEEDDIGPS